MELTGGVVRTARQGMVPAGDSANHAVVLEHGGRLGDGSPAAHQAWLGIPLLQYLGQGHEPRGGQRQHADIHSCSDEGDVVWEPFGGLCPGAVVSYRARRKYVAAEIVPEFHVAAAERLAFA